MDEVNALVRQWRREAAHMRDFGSGLTNPRPLFREADGLDERADQLQRAIEAARLRSASSEYVLYSTARNLLGDAYNAGKQGIGYSQQIMELQDSIVKLPEKQ